jgi:orotate phosphoribosyltransferase
VTDVDALLRSTGAMLEGHFKLASGRHSNMYIEKFRIMEDPAATVAMCGMIADHYRDKGISLVVGPAMGGVILAYETARQLGIHSIYAEKDGNGGLMFDRGFRIEPGQPVLVIDDVLTTGGSVRKTIELVEATGGKVAGVGFLIDRTNGTTDFGLPFFASHTMSVISYPADDCPLCREGLPLDET